MSGPDAEAAPSVPDSGPEARLRAHVDAILDRSSVRRDRGDLAEELYGHLWQRWHDAVEAGLSEDAAADVATSRFGTPDRLAHDLTASYHSRAFASTIGVVVSGAATGPMQPPGYWRLRAFTWLTVFVWTGIAGGAIADLTPMRALLVAIGYLVGGVAFALAGAAFPQRQAWAATFWRLSPPVIVLGIVTAYVVGGKAAAGPGPFVLGSLIIAAPWLYRLGSIDAWTIRRPVRRRVLVGLLFLPLGGVILAASSAFAPDASQTTARDVSVSVTTRCERVAATGELAIDANVDVTWARTDVLPFGLLGGGRSGEVDLVWMRVPSVEHPLAVADPFTAIDTASGKPLPFRVENTGLNDDLSVSNDRAAIVEPETMKAGHRYVFTWHFVLPAAEATDVTARGVSGGFAHIDRFGLEATAPCNGVARAVEMAKR